MDELPLSTQIKNQICVAFCGGLASGKSTTVTQLLSLLGQLPAAELEKLKSQDLGIHKFLDKLPQERKANMTVTAKFLELSVNQKSFTFFDVPGAHKYVKNMITAISQADAAVLLAPVDAVEQSISPNWPYPAETRQHALVLSTFGFKQLVVLINKMDTVEFSQEKFNDACQKVREMLLEVGWEAKAIEQTVCFLPVSSLSAENLVSSSEKMPWWKGVDVIIGEEKIHVNTLMDALNHMKQKPHGDPNASLRAPVSHKYKIPGVGTVLRARVEQGQFKVGDEVLFVPRSEGYKATRRPPKGTIQTIHMHKKPFQNAQAGDLCAFSVKMDTNDPDVGQMMISSDRSVFGTACATFTVQVTVYAHPSEFGVGLSPIAVFQNQKICVILSAINWFITPDSQEPQPGVGGTKLKKGFRAECVFKPTQECWVDETAGLCPIVFLDSCAIVLAGNVTSWAGLQNTAQREEIPHPMDTDAKVLKDLYSSATEPIAETTGLFLDAENPYLVKGLDNLNDQFFHRVKENLQFLYLWIDQEDVPKHMFDELKDLKVLHVTNTIFSPLAVPTGLTNLTRLTLENCIGEILPGAFAAMSSLTYFQLLNNRIPKLGKGSFQGLSQLKELHFNSNQTQVIERGAFDGIPELNLLSLQNNLISRIAPGIFQDVKRLSHLILTGNPLKALAAGIGGVYTYCGVQVDRAVAQLYDPCLTSPSSTIRIANYSHILSDTKSPPYWANMRCLWIGAFKDEDSLFALFPKEIIQHIFFNCWGTKAEWQEACKLTLADALHAHEQGNFAGTELVGDYFSLRPDSTVYKDRARDWFQKAADAGRIDAHFRLGLHFQFSQGSRPGPDNTTRFMHHYTKAIEGGHHQASFYLGWYYYQQKQYDLAVPYLATILTGTPPYTPHEQRLREHANHLIGETYYLGRLGEPNYEAAYEHFSATKTVTSNFGSGVIWQLGRGREANFQKAAECYRATESKNNYVYNNLGVGYANQGNYEKAIENFNAGINLGGYYTPNRIHQLLRFHIGILHAQGKGVTSVGTDHAETLFKLVSDHSSSGPSLQALALFNRAVLQTNAEIKAVLFKSALSLDPTLTELVAGDTIISKFTIVDFSEADFESKLDVITTSGFSQVGSSGNRFGQRSMVYADYVNWPL